MKTYHTGYRNFQSHLNLYFRLAAILKNSIFDHIGMFDIKNQIDFNDLIIHFLTREKLQINMQNQQAMRELRNRPNAKKIIKEQRKAKQGLKSRRGHWRNHEQVKYIQFIRKYYYIMRSSLLRYHYRIFTTMANQIGSRSAVQCKSHHQKMLKKVNYCIENLIFTEEDLSSPIRVGEGLDGNHLQAVKEGIKNVKTNERIPFFIIKTAQKFLIVVDDRFMQNY